MATPNYKKISIIKALKLYDNNQSELARFFEVDRATIGKWNSRNNGYLPELYARRLVDEHPELLK